MQGCVRACVGLAVRSGRSSGHEGTFIASRSPVVDGSDDAHLATPLVLRPGFTYNPQITPLNPRFSPTTFIRCDDLLHRFFSFRRAADKRYSLGMNSLAAIDKSNP